MAAKVKALQGWCKAQCDGYRDVNITNMTSSWKSGLAFCAIIHRYRPDLIDYDSLSKEDVFENNKLAFEVAERELNIPALLDAEDMVAMAVPDKLCIVTYVSQYYNHLANKEKLGGPGVKGKTGTKRTLPRADAATDSKKALTAQTNAQSESAQKAARRGSSMSDICAICKQKVYVMERHMDGSRLYHRRCIREQQRSLPRKSTNEKPFSAISQFNKDKGFVDKENKKPTVTSHEKSLETKPTVTKPTTTNTTTSSQLFTKLHSAPKPYSSSAINSETKSPTFSLSKSNVPKPNTSYSSMDLGLTHSTDTTKSQEKPKFKAHFYGNKQNNPLLKPLNRTKPATQEEPMDTGTEKYEIVGRVVNEPHSTPASAVKSHVLGTKNSTSDASQSGNVVTAKTFSGSEPMTAHVTRTNVNKAGDSGSDTQVLQGLLKNLAGIRNKQNGAITRDPEHTSHFSEKPSTTPTSQVSETPAFTKVVLKPTPKPESSPPVPKQPPPNSMTPSAHTPTSTNTKTNDIPKPKQRQSKLVTDGDEKLKSGENGTSKYSPKSILKQIDTRMDTNETSKYSPKAILKNRTEIPEKSDKQIPIVPKRSAPPTPPLSVFKSNDKTNLLGGVQLDSSDEFESKEDTSSKLKRPCVMPVIPPRPSADPVGVKRDTNIDSANKSHLVAKSFSPDEKSKVNAKTSQPKNAWQIELEARQGIRQHEPKRTAINTKRPDTSSSTAKSPAEQSKPEWQVEAEKRQAQREAHREAEQQSHPVAPPRRKAPPRPTSPPKLHASDKHDKTAGTGAPSYGGLDMGGLVKKHDDSSPKSHTDDEEPSNYLRASVTSDDDPFGRTSKTRGSGGVARKPAFRLDDDKPSGQHANAISNSETSKAHMNGDHTDETPSWVEEAKRRNAARNGVYVDPEKKPYKHDGTDLVNPQPKKKIIPDTRFTFSYDFEAQNNKDPHKTEDSQQVSYPWGTDMRNRPLPDVPTFSPPKRRVNAEERMAMHEIIEQLEHLDAALQILEHDGRALEDKIRLGTDEEMDEGVLMVQWFELVNQKNELVRKETDLMFKKKQQELEDEHEDIEYELRCLLEKPDHMKTPSEKVREESLLQELMDTVSLRNSIVDTIEENRIKYIEEDKEIAQVMAMRGFCANPPPAEPEKPAKNGKKKKAKKKDKEKRNSNGVLIDTKKVQ